MAAEAVRLLNDKIEGKNEVKQTIFEADLIEKESFLKL
jgi:DNA-binding LacI/PurR family transcriptional regulator